MKNSDADKDANKAPRRGNLNFKNVAGKFFSFRGSVRLKEFGARSVLVMALSILNVLLFEMLSLRPLPAILSWVLLASIYSLIVRRLRDSGMPVLLALLGVIPFFGWGILMYLAIWKHDPSEEFVDEYQRALSSSGGLFFTLACTFWVLLLS